MAAGAMSETPLESHNKYLKFNRTNMSRKCSREATITDMFTRSWYTSDPMILYLATNFELKSKKEELPPRVNEILLNPKD